MAYKTDITDLIPKWGCITYQLVFYCLKCSKMQYACLLIFKYLYMNSCFQVQSTRYVPFLIEMIENERQTLVAYTTLF